MDEFIARGTFKERVEERYCKPCKAEGKDHNGCWCRACWVDDMIDEVDCFQPADVAPVVYGLWKYYHKRNKAVCTCCSFERDLDENFGAAISCPNCGAKMDIEDGGDNNEAD